MLGNASNDDRLFVGCSFLRSVLVSALDSVVDVQARQLYATFRINARDFVVLRDFFS